MLRPFVHIRIGRLWCDRIGVLTVVPEFYLCERDAGLHPDNTLDIWYLWDRDSYMLDHKVKPRDAASNSQLTVMWERILHVWDPARYLYYLIRMLEAGENDFIVPLSPHYDEQGLLSRFPAHLSFTDEEIERGLAGLLEMGIGPDDKFVCFHARDSAYLDLAYPKDIETHGDWRWQDIRNTSIENYLPAVEHLTSLGYFAIRMGKLVEKAINCPNPRIIDYATQFHSDFMDVFLSAHCSFFIGTASGMIRLPMVFRRPVVYTNMTYLFDVQDLQCENTIAILTKLYSKEKGRNLTYREVLDLGLARYSLVNPEHKRLQESLGLKVIENTPEEISALVMEMLDTLNSENQWTEEDQELQNRFLTLLRAYPNDVPMPEEAPTPKFGRQFLKDNQALLD